MSLETLRRLDFGLAQGLVWPMLALCPLPWQSQRAATLKKQASPSGPVKLLRLREKGLRRTARRL